MPIQFSSNIKDVHFNGNIKEVYYGSTKVWSKTPAVPYIPLQYITIPTMSQGDFLNDFNPTITTNNTYICEFKVRPDANSVGQNVGAGFCDVDGDNFGAAVGHASWNGTRWSLWGKDWGTTSVAVSASTSTDAVCALAINPSSSGNFARLQVATTSTTWDKSNFSVSHWGHFHIDGCSKDASLSGEATLSGRWYYVKETLGGTLVHNYIPAKSLDGTKVGFYDTITDQWVLCSAGAAWSAGPESNGLLMAHSGPSLTQQLLDAMASDSNV